jgi:hypothetical protein
MRVPGHADMLVGVQGEGVEALHVAVAPTPTPRGSRKNGDQREARIERSTMSSRSVATDGSVLDVEEESGG